MPVPPRLLLAALLGAAVALATAAWHWAIGRLRHRRHAQPTRPTLSPARAIAVAAAASHPRRALPSDPHTAALSNNTRDLASFMPIRPGRLYRTASPLASDGRGAVALAGPPFNVATLVDLRSRAEWGGGGGGRGGSGTAAVAAALGAAVGRLPPRTDRPGRDAAVALAGHWHRWWRRRWSGRGGGAGWHPPPADPPLVVAMEEVGAGSTPPPSLAIIHAPVQAWAPYLRWLVLGHVPPSAGLGVLAVLARARLAGLRPPVPAVRARLEAAAAAAGLAGMYRALLDAFGPEIVGAVSAVADALTATRAAPVVVACKLGKDRTGLVCALLGLAAGAPEAAILADYGASAEATSTLPPGLGAWAAGAPADALAAALDHLDECHGGWGAYLASHGFGVGAQAALAAALRE